jgi:enoyl-CoA hydratase
MVHELVPAEDLLDRAVAVAEQTPADCLEQYAFTKRACQAAALRDIADPLDGELPDGMTSDQARHAHRRYRQQLKDVDGPWRGARGSMKLGARRPPTSCCLGAG